MRGRDSVGPLTSQRLQRPWRGGCPLVAPRRRVGEALALCRKALFVRDSERRHGRSESPVAHNERQRGVGRALCL